MGRTSQSCMVWSNRKKVCSIILTGPRRALKTKDHQWEYLRERDSMFWRTSWRIPRYNRLKTHYILYFPSQIMCRHIFQYSSLELLQFESKWNVIYSINKMYKSHDPNSNELLLIIKFLRRNKSAKIESLFKLNSKKLKVQILSFPVSHLHSLSRRAFETLTHKFTLHHFNPHIFFYIQHTTSLFNLDFNSSY